jgi:CheY-like chemotaxis protein
VILSPKAAEALSLAIHELATNALKHGALSAAGGRVRVRWKRVDRGGAAWVRFDWKETGAPEPPPSPDGRRKGFGSELIEARVPYELGGEGVLTIGPGGAECHIEFPLEAGDSILETDAPQPATVFGGELDMTGGADLSGQRVLVVEDDYFIAADETSALQGAGAEVIGPCQTRDAALAALADRRPTGAIVDINLGEGPSFAVAEALRDRSVPFVFVTGYDQSVIPTAFAGIQRLQKPLDLRQAVRSLAEAIAQARG